MIDDSPRWEEINPSEFPHERDGLRELASYLPDDDPYHVWANVEFVATDGSVNEIDALVLTRSGLWVLELKHWQGEITGDGNQWVRRMGRGRLSPVDNPYVLTNRKAKRLGGLIRHYARKKGVDPSLFIGAAVFLHARTMRANLDDIGGQHVYGLDRHPPSRLPSLKEMLLATPRDPRDLVDAKRGREIVELVRGARIRPSVARRKVGELLLLPKPYAEGIGWQDFLAGHPMDKSVFRRVRFYLTRGASEEELPLIRRAAEREFRLLQGIHHPGIARALDLVDHQWGPAVVFDHTVGSQRLDQWLQSREEKLTLAQRLHLLEDLAEIVEYAHSRRLAHRALHPRAIVVTDPDLPRPALVVTDWQTGGRLATSTQLSRLSSTTGGAGLELFFDDEVRLYQAPEASYQSNLPGTRLDVFSLGAIAYRIFARTPPAASPEELIGAVRGAGLDLAAAVDGLPEKLVELVAAATRGDPADRIATVADFRRGLEDVWEELTAPEPEPVIDPLTARKGDVLEYGLKVVRRLGAGATAVALLVEERADAGRRELVLKVARDESHAERLATEARTVEELKHWQVASLVRGPVMVGGRTALLLDSAGDRTLAEELQGGRLAWDLLKRYGRDLMEIVVFLEGQGVWHRDLKPANLAARPRPRDRELHLCAFDFSLAATPADQLAAGTPPYLDPFLGPPRRMRYDSAAERFAAAVTLYEMATGTQPKWGDNANPAAVTDEVTLDPGAFVPEAADRLVDFFARALARDAARRFDTAEEMSDAWRDIFKELPAPTPATVDTLTRGSALDAVGLTVRARTALERLGVHTVGELLDYEPSELTRARGVPDATRREILAQVRALRERLAAPPEASADRPLAVGVEALCETLLRARRPAKERQAMRVLLGQAPTVDGTFEKWPAQSDVAAATGNSQPQVSIWLRKYTKEWLTNPSLEQVRNEIVALLDSRGAVMSADELAEALIAARGSYTTGPQRLAQAVGLVRAAVETELAQGGDARLAIHRFWRSNQVLVGREPDDPTSLTTAADLLAYAVRLGGEAAKLVRADPLPTRARAVEELRALPVPEDMPALSDQRLLHLAAAASNGMAGVNAQGQLYPVGMAAERALRLAAPALAGQRFTPDQLRERVLARYPLAQRLPGRPDLDDLVRASGMAVWWDAATEEYVPRAVAGLATSTRPANLSSPLLGPSASAEADDKLAATIAHRGYLAVLAPLRLLAGARRGLIDRLRLTEVDVTAILLERLRALDFPWEVIVAADNGVANDADFRGLVDLVHHEVMPAVERALAVESPMLITEAAPLARYGQLRLLQELADPTRPRPAARLLLLPARRPEPVLLDSAQVPLTSPASQSLWLPELWINPVASAPS